MAPPVAILREDNRQSSLVTRQPISSKCVNYGGSRTIRCFATLFGEFTVCDRAKVHNDCNFDYNKPHRHKYVHRLNVLHSWQLGFDCGV